MKEFRGPPWLRAKLINNLSPWICVCFEMGHMCIIVRWTETNNNRWAYRNWERERGGRGGREANRQTEKDKQLKI